MNCFNYALLWAKVQEKLASSGTKLWGIQQMERTGGEPGLIGQDAKTGEYLFVDCSAESPTAIRKLGEPYFVSVDTILFLLTIMVLSLIMLQELLEESSKSNSNQQDG